MSKGQSLQKEIICFKTDHPEDNLVSENEIDHGDNVVSDKET